MRELLDWCESRRAGLLETIEALVRLESPSHDKVAVDRCGRELERRLEAIGGRVERLPQASRGDHLRATFFEGPAQVLLLGHFDTVWDVGELERMPFRQEDGRLHGPGVFDMKAGIAVAAHAVQALTALDRVPSGRVVMLWTTDEEIGSGTSRSIIEAEARRSSAVLVLEPSLPGGAVKTSRKGCGQFELVASGVPAHAGIDPSKGVSAILELAHQIVALQELQNAARGVSVNVGVIAGGTRPNVVAEEARATVDVRAPTQADAESLEHRIRSLAPVDPRARLTVTGGVERPPLERSAAVAQLYGVARAVAAELGRELPEGGTGGGSDGNFTAALGVPTLDGLGPAGDGAHARHEHVLLGGLCWRAALVAGMLQRLIPGKSR